MGVAGVIILCGAGASGFGGPIISFDNACLILILCGDPEGLDGMVMDR